MKCCKRTRCWRTVLRGCVYESEGIEKNEANVSETTASKQFKPNETQEKAAREAKQNTMQDRSALEAEKNETQGNAAPDTKCNAIPSFRIFPSAPHSLGKNIKELKEP